MNLKLLSFITLAAIVSCVKVPSDGIHTLCVLSTNDVHGAYFDSTYVGGQSCTSLMSVKSAVDSVKGVYGEDNVLLIDVGDNLQGDNAAYYFNYIDTLSPHIYPRLAAALGYDAVILGNHDIETGHPVYDRLAFQFKKAGIPYLAGNAIKDDGSRYFEYYHVFRKAGLKVLLLGYDNAAIATWLGENLWSGMHFESLLPLVQNDIDAMKIKLAPDIVIVAAHTGTGTGDGTVLENQGLDLLKTLNGVDVVLAAHDHRAYCDSTATAVLVNSGTKCRFLGQALVSVDVQDGKSVSKSHSASVIALDKDKVDAALSKKFREDYLKVQRFTLREVGELDMDLATKESFKGMCDYMNLIHTVTLKYSGAKVSFAAPLTYNKTIPAGKLVFNDMFTIYPFENTLMTMSMTGKEIKDYLEYSYDSWINDITASHILKISYKPKNDGTGMGWFFDGRSYNFDSAGGLIYTVDVRRPAGQRVVIASFADGSKFDFEAEYVVGLSSYRASGGGNLVTRGAGIEDPDARIIDRYQDLRGLILDYIQENGSISSVLVSKPEVIGNWAFVPEYIAGARIQSDFELLFSGR